jgi:hypothetical protein
MCRGIIFFLSCWIGAGAGVARAGAPTAAKATDQPPHRERVLADAVLRNLSYGPDHPMVKESEAAVMLAAILKGGSMGGDDGWFGPGASRYGWSWLAARHGVGIGGSIARDAWRGPQATFDRLDRNHDGELSAADFDWSDKSPAVREERIYRQWFAKMDGDSNGQISRKEWESLFDRVAAGKDHLNLDDLRRAFPLAPPGGGKTADQKPPKGFQQILLKGFFQSELGSPFPGPKVGAPAPDFTLLTHDGKQKVTLSDYHGNKPVVLIFGNFT